MKKTLLSLSLILLIALGFFVYLKSNSRPHLTVMGYVRMADGLGRQTVEVIDTFKDEMSVSFVPTHRNRLQDVPKRLHKILKTKNRPLGKVILFEDCLWLPNHHPYKKLQTPVRDDQIRIAYSMFESSRIPAEWTIILNTYFDAVAVPDPYFVSVYKESGVKIPVFVVPLAVDLSPNLKFPVKNCANTPFTFANLSTCVDRKNQLTLVRAFAKEFGNNKKVSLLINARAAFNKLDFEIVKEIKNLGLANVIFNINPLSKSEYQDLFHEIDCYVNLSKGEGFSIQPREAMALGIPVIVTDNTAQSTLCASGLVTPVSSTIKKPAFYDWGDYYGHSFDCTIDDAAAALKEVYDNYPTYLKRGEEARAFAAKSQYIHLKPLYRTLIKPKKVMLGTENRVTEDTLITNSPTLYQKYKQL